MNENRRETIKRRVLRWIDANRSRLFIHRRIVGLYMKEDDQLRSAGTPEEHIGDYDQRLDLDRVVDDVIEHYQQSHPLGRGTSERDTGPLSV